MNGINCSLMGQKSAKQALTSQAVNALFTTACALQSEGVVLRALWNYP
jgi:hypothetical protein